MENAIFAKAAAARDMIAARGLTIGPLSCSENRHGQFSAYFDVAGGSRVRISDHDCNDRFRVAEFNMYDTSAAAIDRFVRNRFWNMAVSAELAIIRRSEERRTATVRKAAFEQQVDATVANNAKLTAAGYDVVAMTKNQRKSALKALRA